MHLRKSFLGLCILVLAILSISGCDDDGNSTKPDMDFDYPLAIGSN